MIFFADENKTLAPTYDIGWEFFDMMVRDHIQQYNYTLNPEGIFNAIKYMYTYYPDPNNRSHIREEFVNVSFSHLYVHSQDCRCLNTFQLIYQPKKLWRPL